MSDLQNAMTEWSKHNDNVQYLLRTSTDEMAQVEAMEDRTRAAEDVAALLSRDHTFVSLSVHAKQAEGWENAFNKMRDASDKWKKNAEEERERVKEAEARADRLAETLDTTMTERDAMTRRGLTAEDRAEELENERDDLHDLSVKLAFKLVQAGHAGTLEALRDDAYAKSILNRPDMQESLRQMRDGEVRSTEEIEQEIAERGTSLWDEVEDEIDAAKVEEALKTPDDTVPFKPRGVVFDSVGRGHYTCCGRCTGQSEGHGCTCVSDSLVSERHGERWCCDERTTPRQSVLDEAGVLIHGDRNAHYGPPMVNFQRIAALWNTYLDDQLTHPILPSQVGWMSMLIKVARNIEAPKRDNAVDAAGYIACAFECETDEQG